MLKHLLFFVFLSKCLLMQLSAQVTVSGYVIDQDSVAIPYANLVIDEKKSFVAHDDGFFSFSLDKGNYQVLVFSVGYKSVEFELLVTEQSIDLGKIILPPLQYGDFGEVEISVNRYSQRAEDLTVSIEVMKPEILENNAVTTISGVAEQTPGVHVADGQANIRGGSGFSYGGGSRVLVLVDGLPIMSADAGDVKWNALPLENIQQMEVIKGAASSLYGSSALNGVINIQTLWPEDSSDTYVRTYAGLYDEPSNKNAVWWNQSPMIFGANVGHLQKIGKHDLVLGGNIHSDQGYRRDETEERMRFNFKTRFHTKNEGLKYGLNGSLMQVDGGQIFVWEDADSGMYVARNDSVNLYQNLRWNIDPYVTYVSEKGRSHHLKSRVFGTSNQNQNNQNSDAVSYYSEYQFSTGWRNHHLIAGAVHQLFDVKSVLYDNHQLENVAGFVQMDFDFNRFKISSGIRYEGFQRNQEAWTFRPNARLGANYRLHESSFLRASFGQGFRYPSIAEQYINTTIPGLFFIPNPELQAESGWSSEIGVKQLFAVGKWKGAVDVAGFWTEYQDMIEFNFDSLIFDFATQYLAFGFQAQNIQRAKINGVESTLMFSGEVGKTEVQFFGGYTYMNPIDLNINKSDTSYAEGDEVLKYRFNHLIKGNLQLIRNQISVGASYRFNSFIRNVDDIFTQVVFGQEVIPGVNDFRARNNQGAHVFDINAGYDWGRIKTQLVVRNAFNEEYATRPAFPGAPRMYMIQVILH